MITAVSRGSDLNLLAMLAVRATALTTMVISRDKIERGTMAVVACDSDRL